MSNSYVSICPVGSMWTEGNKLAFFTDPRALPYNRVIDAQCCRGFYLTTESMMKTIQAGYSITRL